MSVSSPRDEVPGPATAAPALNEEPAGAGQQARYLRLLGVEAGPPSFELLSTLVRRQLLRCPFENLSKVMRARRLGLKRLPTLTEHLDGLEHQGLGGTCYANNFHFAQLLSHLGYDCAFCGADMEVPDLHSVLRVTLEGRDYLLDVGYAAPFYAPLPRDAREVVEVTWGNDTYRLHPQDARGRSRLDQLRDGERVHGYTVNPAPRQLGDFEGVIRASFADSALFMRILRIERFFEEGSLSLTNRRLRRVEGGRVSLRDLAGRAEVLTVLERDFGVAREAAKAACDALPATAL